MEEEGLPLKVASPGAEEADDDALGKGHEIEKEVQVLQFYAQPWWKLALFSVLFVLTGGTIWLASLWYPALYMLLTMAHSSPQCADYVYVELLDKRCAICKVHSNYSPGFKKVVRWFVFHTVRFMYGERHCAFQAVAPAPPSLAEELVHASRAVGEGAPFGPTPSTRQKRKQLYGDNLLEVEAPSFWRIFGHDAAQPFYCFQYASVAIWMYEDYYTYSAVVLVITMASIITNVISQYKERKRMAEMAYYVCDVERVCKDVEELAAGPKGLYGHLLVSSPSLVPGDLVVVVPGKAACDMVLLDGEVVVDETILTGESVPVRKTVYDPELEGPYCSDASSTCTIFNGTSVVAARGGRGGKPALALVATTGFHTAKGQLLRAIMFPVQHDLQFVKQAMYFIIMMLVVACGFYLWNVVAMVGYHASTRDIAVKALDLITVAVPPALACCLAIATTISVARLKKRGVHVQDNERVRVAGLLDTICFDKTGTLTDIGLEFGGALPASRGRFGQPTYEPGDLPPHILELFSTCHGLTQLQQQVVGDPLDQRLFEASGFEIGFEDQLPSIVSSPAPAEPLGGSKEPSLRSPLQSVNASAAPAAPVVPTDATAAEPTPHAHSGSLGGSEIMGAATSADQPPPPPLPPPAAALPAGPYLVVRRGPTAPLALYPAVAPLHAPPAPTAPEGTRAPQARPQPLQVPLSAHASDTAARRQLAADHEPLLPPHAAMPSHVQPPEAAAAAAAAAAHSTDSSRGLPHPLHHKEAALHSRLAPVPQVESVGPSMMDRLAAHGTASPQQAPHQAHPHGFFGARKGAGAEGGACGEDDEDDDDNEILPCGYGTDEEQGGGGCSPTGTHPHGIHLATEPFPPSESLHVLRRFDFSSERLRCTCVALHPNGRVVVHVKGSPERLLAFMDPASVPTDFTHMLQEYTNQGLRVIGMASRELPGPPNHALRLSQDELEAGCAFMGLVLMVNRLKPESAPTIAHLHTATIRTAMVTGDHVRTAINVARQCGIMDAATPALIVDVGKGVPHNDTAFTFEVVHPLLPDDGPQLCPSPRTHRRALQQQQKQQQQQQKEQELAVLYSGTGPSQLQPRQQQDGLQAKDGNPPAAHTGFLEQQAALRYAASGDMQVALTGAAWQQLLAESARHAELKELVLQRGRVFARMSPESKRGLLGLLGFGDVDAHGQAHAGCGYYTGFCGDGANDMGALKGALVGVSLCDAEASIAAPMTSRIPHVGVMITVVAEGRCSMITSLIIFKYTMVYAFIQVLALALLYNRGLTVGNFQYLLQDMLHTTLLASCMGLTEPARKLGLRRPPSRVLCMAVILPVVSQLAVDTLFQLLALYLLEHEPWFVPFDTAAHETLDISVSEKRPEAGVLFIVACWQLVINALVFNVGKPFRRGLWTNSWLLGVLAVLVTFDLYVLWAPGDAFRRKVPAVIDLPLLFRAKLAALILANLVAAYTADWLVVRAHQLFSHILARWRASAPRGYELASLRMGLASLAKGTRTGDFPQERGQQRLLPPTALSSAGIEASSPADALPRALQA